jgi:hypothetical protein
MFNSINHMVKANQDHNVLSPCPSKNCYYQYKSAKKKKKFLEENIIAKILFHLKIKTKVS